LLWSALLLAPIGPSFFLYQQVSDQLAAESIAMQGLRAAMLQPEAGWQEELGRHLPLLAQSWGKSLGLADLSCGECGPGDLVTLEVRVGDAVAIQTAGIEPE
jgi:hypothetical protein